jgi:hypothetical protein
MTALWWRIFLWDVATHGGLALLITLCLVTYAYHGSIRAALAAGMRAGRPAARRLYRWLDRGGSR